MEHIWWLRNNSIHNESVEDLESFVQALRNRIAALVAIHNFFWRFRKDGWMSYARVMPKQLIKACTLAIVPLFTGLQSIFPIVF
ncbi:hypothetical protein FEM48_Zijuj01G0106000 [Ziziphus jujuba var. spinosa]|uniref:Uncharacterized protein n=1 Tax=Ziziphus jujuba var. spinosa TaxID=714518 RepID=A0A978W0S1_ZIZJJ|nr:hypothetical protein FEM48_Zijuj01G0106000 [Ziziphus jujuba var. spinosa]